MKKALALLLALVMCLSLCACGDGNSNSKTTNGETDISNPTNGETTNTNDTTSSDNSNTTEGNNSEAETPWIIYDRNETPYVNKDKMVETLEIIELTTENWRNYIKVYSSNDVEYRLGAGDERYHQFSKDFTIELKNKETDEVVTYEWSNDYGVGLLVSADFDLNNYDCLKVGGSIFFFNLPEEFASSDSFGIAWYEGDLMMACSTTFLIMEGTKIIVSMDEIAEILGQ